MHYLGGKSRIRKQIVPLIQGSITPTIPYLEPFVGAGWILSEIKANVRIASDMNQSLVKLLDGVSNKGLILPNEVTEQQYKDAINLSDSDPLKAFIGIGCAFSGKWFGGFARSQKRNYAANAKNSLLKKASGMRGTIFSSGSYAAFNPKGFVIYCDPPYGNTTGYSKAGNFDSAEFWKIMNEWAKENTVFVSEYEAPEDWKCVLEIQTKTDLHGKGRLGRVEKVFTK